MLNQLTKIEEKSILEEPQDRAVALRLRNRKATNRKLQRRKEAGFLNVTLFLSADVMAFVDQLRHAQNFPGRSEVVEWLFQQELLHRTDLLETRYR